MFTLLITHSIPPVMLSSTPSTPFSPFVTPCHSLSHLVSPHYPSSLLVITCYPLSLLVTPYHSLSPLITPHHLLSPPVIPHMPSPVVHVSTSPTPYTGVHEPLILHGRPGPSGCSGGDIWQHPGPAPAARQVPPGFAVSSDRPSQICTFFHAICELLSLFTHTHAYGHSCLVGGG